MAANREYKSSVFTFLFNEPERLRELYSALTGAKLPPEAQITINTLEGALFMTLQNDISFAVDNILIVLFEHQSTRSPNMALRFFQYIAEIYRKLIDNAALHGSAPVRVPRPAFFVLYNGVASAPDMEIQRLSALFTDAASSFTGPDLPSLELAVKVVNINEGRSAAMMELCETLKGYAAFVAKAREYGAEKKDNDLKEAIAKAARWCIAHGFLKEFLTSHLSEVVDMLYDEVTLDDILAVRDRDARIMGREEERELVARNALAEGASLEFVQKITGLDTGTLQSLAGQ